MIFFNYFKENSIITAIKIKTKQNHPVTRKKRQGKAHQNVNSDYVPSGNLFSPLLCFLSF